MSVAGIINVGTVTYNTTKTGTTLPVGAPVTRDYRWNEYELYAQDTWKVLKDLSITYGLRYSYLQVPAETSGTQLAYAKLSTMRAHPGHFH